MTKPRLILAERIARGKDIDQAVELLATLRSFERLIDAAEHVVLVHDEGLNLDSAIAALAEATPKREGRVG